MNASRELSKQLVLRSIKSIKPKCPKSADKRPLVVEPLEPRVLFSADLIPGTQGDAGDVDIYETDSNVTLIPQLRQDDTRSDAAPDAMEMQKDSAAVPEQNNTDQQPLPGDTDRLHQQLTADSTVSSPVHPVAFDHSDQSTGENDTAPSPPQLQPEADHSVNLIFLNQDISKAEDLLTEVKRVYGSDAEWIVIDLQANEDGIREITESLNGVTDVNAIHIIGEEKENTIQVGSVQLDTELFHLYQDDISQWRHALAETTDQSDRIFLHGTHITDDSGTALIAELKNTVDVSVQLVADVVQVTEETPGSAGKDNPDSDRTPQQISSAADTTEPAAETTIVGNQRTELVFIDAKTPDAQLLLDNIRSNTSDTVDLHIIEIASGASGLSIITESIVQFDEVSALHIISHGSDGTVNLGNEALNLETLSQHESIISSWADALDDSADILIYGCDVADTDYGREFINAFAQVSGADVAASDNITGHNNLGGDWQLEANTGEIETDTVLTDDVSTVWQHSLLTYTVTNTLDGGAGSLRQAILDANASVGIPDTIQFSISGSGPHTFTPSTPLPDITDPLFIDGWSEPDYASDGVPVIVIDASGAGSGDGLTLDVGSDNSTIRGLSIIQAPDDGVTLISSNNWIYGNYIGVNVGGVTAAGNADNGIQIEDSSNGNLIGTDGDSVDDAFERNVIGGNRDGINALGNSTSSGRISGNYIGVGADGVSVVGNTNDGIYFNNGPDFITIGGATPALGNVISGNGANGIYFNGELTDNNTIQNNLIGTSADGSTLIGQQSDGIWIYRGGDGNTILDNIIAGSDVVGIELDGASDGTIILGNTIGTDSTGTLNWGSGENGILIENGTTNTTIGGTTAGEGNTIANSGRVTSVFISGILVENNNTNVSIRGNSIFGNTGPGIDLSEDNFAEGTSPNDAGDTDTGGNNVQNWAVLNSAAIDNAGTFSYEFDTTTLTAGTYTVDFYASTDRNHGEVEGKRYLGTVSGVGNGTTYTGTFGPVTLNPGEYITLITSDANGNSSEFSNYAVAVDSDAGGSTPVSIQPTSTHDGGLRIDPDGGNDAYLEVNNGGAILDGLSAFTMEHQFSSTDNVGSHGLLEYSDTTDRLSANVTSTGFLEVYINGSYRALSGINYQTGLFDGAKHSLAISWDNAAGDLNVYVDGVQTDAITGVAPGQTIGSADFPLVIGRQYGSTGQFNTLQTTDLTLYDVRIFDAVRSDAEIYANYQTTLPQDEQNLRANWRFDEYSIDGVIPDVVDANNITVKHAVFTGATTANPALTFWVSENAQDGEVVGTVTGQDVEREALKASLLAANPNLFYSAETNKFYEVDTTAKTWSVAESDAALSTLNGVNGQLVQIRSALENDVVTDALNTTGTTQAHIGASDTTVEGEWRWGDAVSGPLFWQENNAGRGVVDEYSNWPATKPDNVSGLQHYGRLLATGLWDDLEESIALRSIIEYDAEQVLDNTESLTYSILTQTPDNAFTVKPSTGEITVAQADVLDYETNATHSVTIRVTDANANTFDRTLNVSLYNETETTATPTDLTSGIELNTDGGNDAYLVAADGTAVLGGLQQFTYETTFAGTAASGNDQFFVSYATATSDNTLVLQTLPSNDLRLNINGVNHDSSGIDFNALLFDGDKHTLSVSWDNTNGDITVYVDGELTYQATGLGIGASVYPDAGGSLLFGQEQGIVGGAFNSDWNFEGTLYDVRVWNEVRSAADIALNYQYKFDTGSTPAGLVAAWQMEFNGTNEVIDIISEGTSNNRLSIGHASGTGFTASTPVSDLHVDENASVGTTVGYVVPNDADTTNDIATDGLFTEGLPSGSSALRAAGASFGSWEVETSSIEGLGGWMSPAPLGGIPVELAGGSIKQTLTTQAGTSYQVVFAVNGDFTAGNPVKEFRASAGGVSQDFQFQQPASWSATNPLWENRSFTFTADSTSTDLRFTSLDTGSEAQASVISDVQVLEIPAAVSILLKNDATLQYDAATNKFYRLVNTPDTLTNVLTAATGSTLNGISGQLGTIRSAYENSLFKDWVAEAGNEIWLGATDSNDEGNWTWLTGNVESTEQFWTGGSGGAATTGYYAPTFSQSEAAGEDYVRITDTGTWSDEDPSISHAYVVEWDATEVVSNFTYRLTDDADGRFSIDSQTGQVSVANGYKIDYEVATSHNITVEVTDPESNTHTEIMSITVDPATELDISPTDLSSGIELNLDGGNDAYLQATDGGEILGGVSKFTTEFSFSTGYKEQLVLISYLGGPGRNDLSIELESDGSAKLIVDNSSVSGITDFDFNTLRDGQIHSLAVSWSNTNGDWNLYVDGNKVSSGTNLSAGETLNGSSGTGSLVFGQEQDVVGSGFSSGQLFKGTLYDVRIWDYVRSEADIELNYKQKLDGSQVPPGLLANWQMEFNGSDEVIDIVTEGTTDNRLIIGHATGSGFTTSLPVTDLNVDENATNGTAVGFVVPSVPNLHNDIVSDGTFRHAGATTSQTVPNGQTLGGTGGSWTVTSGTIDLEGGWPDSPLGGTALNLDGTTPGAISQTLQTTSGNQYQILFAVTGNFQGTTTDVDLNLTAGSQSLDFHIDKPADWATNNLLWEQRSMTFVADSATTELTISSLSESNLRGPVIGDIQVIQIPEPIGAILNADSTLSYNSATGKFYKAVEGDFTWLTANTSASAAEINGVTGQLVTINDAYENEIVRQLASTLTTPEDVWIGASDTNNEGQWHWFTNGVQNDNANFWTGDENGSAEPGFYANWLNNVTLQEPNAGMTNEDYARLSYDSGNWRDTDSSVATYSYVVEWDAREVISNYTFDMTDTAGGRFAINPDTGEITVADGTLLDHENADLHNVTVEVSDAAGNTYSEVLAIAVNDRIELSQMVPGAQATNEDTPLEFSIAAGNEIVIDDSLAAQDTLIQVAIDNGSTGTFTLSQTTGITIVEGSDGGDFITMQGTVANINAALDGLLYTPNNGYSGTPTITVTTTLGADLDGRYEFEGNYDDTSAGTLQHGTVAGNASLTPPDATRGNVLVLDGNRDYVTVPSTFSEPSNVTLSAWINLSGTAASAGDVISIDNNVLLRVNAATGGLIGSYYDGTAFRNISTGPDTGLADDQWHHVAFVIDDTNDTQYLYLDGQLAASDHFSNSIDYQSANSRTGIGAHANTSESNFDFNGKIDDARIYSRALTAAEITAIATDQTDLSDSIPITVNSVNDQPVLELPDGITKHTPAGSGDHQGRNTAIQPDGKILVTGTYMNGAETEALIVRYNSDGTLDTSFGGGTGVVTGDFGDGDSNLFRSIAIEPGGKIYVSGYAQDAGIEKALFVRYNADGSIDTSFATTGYVVSNVSSTWSIANGITIQPDGKVVASGFSVNSGNYDMTAWRFNTDGTPDTTFDTDGIAIIDFAGRVDVSYKVVVQPDGRIVLAGFVQPIAGGTDFAVLRLNPDGSVDNTFGGGDGFATAALNGSGNQDWGFDFALQPDGKILVAGHTNTGASEDSAIVRFDTDGTLDTTFNSTGSRTIAVGSGDDTFRSIALQSDGKIVLTSNAENDAYIIRLNTDGSDDVSFGSGGQLTLPDTEGEQIMEIAVDANDNLIVTGFAVNGSTDQVLVARINSDGTIDRTFDAQFNDPVTYVEGGPSIILDPDIQIYDEELSALDNFSGASTTLQREGSIDPDDSFFVRSGNGIGLGSINSGGPIQWELTKNGITIATIDIDTPGRMQIDFTDVNGEIPTQADVNTILRQITYRNSSDTPPASVQLDWTFDDGNVTAQGIGGALQTIGSKVVNIQNASNLAITAPANETTPEDTAIVFAGANELQVHDGITGVDSLLQVSLTVSNGVLTLANTTGITFIEGSNDTSALVIEGLESDINTALNGLEFTPFENYHGPDLLTIINSVAANLEGQYTFNGGNADDQSAGTADNGVLTGDAATATDVERGEVLDLDGDTDSVVINSTFGQPSNITLTGWVNLNALDTSGANLISVGDSVAIRAHDNFEGSAIGYFYDGTGDWKALNSGVTLTGTGWHHLAYTVDSTNNIQRLYIDGALAAEGNETADIGYNLGTTTVIGAHPGGAGYDLDGSVDDVRVYSRALAADEIAALATDQTQVSDTIALTVTPVNDPPLVNVNTGVSTFIGGTVTISASALNEADPDDDGAELTYTISPLPGNGQLELTSNPGVAINSFTQADVNAGSVIFVHDGATGANGNFDFSLADGGEDGAVADTGTVVITINSATSDSYTTDEATDLNISAAAGLLANDGQGGGTLSGNTVVGYDATTDDDGNAVWTSNIGSVPLTLTGATYTTTPDNPLAGINAAFDFSGASSGATANALHSYPEIDGTQSGTLEAWVYIDSLSGNNMIFDTGDTASTGISVLTSGGQIVLGVGNSGSSNVSTVTAPSAGSWHHIAVVANLNGLNRVTLYVDGTEATRITTPLSNWAPGAFGLGTTNGTTVGGYSGDLAGQIAHLRIHDDALSASAISYHAANPGLGSATPFVAGYDDTGTFGTVSVLADGSFSYSPNGQFESLAAFQVDTDTFDYTYDDGLGNQQTVTSTISVVGLNDAPVLSTIEALPASYTEGNAPVQVSGNLSLSDVDDTNIEYAVVAITTNFVPGGEDMLNFTNQSDISGSFNTGTGVLTLTGSALVSDYQTAIRSITYENTSENPSTLPRTVSFTIYDADTNSNTLSRDITVNAENDPPQITLSGAVSYIENDDATQLAPTAIVTDIDSPDFDGGTMTISLISGADALDELSIISTGSGTGQVGAGPSTLRYEGVLIGSHSGGDGTNPLVINFNSSATEEAVQAVLRQIAFEHLSESPQVSRTWQVTLTDGDTGTTNASENLTITRVNDAPALNSLGGESVFGLNDGTSIDLDQGITASISDPDEATDFAGGSLSMSGVLFNTGDLLEIDTSGTIGLSTGLTNGSTVSVSGVDIGTLTNVSSSMVDVNFNANASIARIESLLQAFTFESTSSTLGLRSVDILLNDGDGTANSGSDSVTSRVNVFVGKAGGGFITTDEDIPYTLDVSDFTFTGSPQASIETITITSIPANGELQLSGTAVNNGDVITRTQLDNNLLTYVPPPEQNGVPYTVFDFYINNGNSNIVVLPGEPNSYVFSGGSWPAADAIIANNQNFGPNGTIPTTVSVAAQSSNINAAYLAQGVLLMDGFVHDSAITNAEFNAIDAWVQAGGILIATSDADTYDPLTSRYGLVTINGGSTTWTVEDGTHPIMDGSFGEVGATFSSAGSIAQFDPSSINTSVDLILARDSVTNNPTMVLRQVGAGYVLLTSDEGIFRANMGVGGNATTPNDILVANIMAWAIDLQPPSDIFTTNVNVTPVNDASILGSIEPATLAYTENDGQVTVSDTLAISDIDDTNIESASISLNANFNSSEDVLAFTNQSGITGAYNSTTGVMTLSGSATIADYQAAIRSVTYENTSDNPSTLTRSVSITVFDGDDNSNTLTRNISVGADNDAPMLTTIESLAANYTENSPGVQITGNLTVDDKDDINLESATVAISNNFANGEDELNFTNQSGISGSYNSGTGILTLFGTASVIDYQTAIRSVTYENSSDNPSSLTRTVSFTINDGSLGSNQLSRDITFTAVNDASVLSAMEALPLQYTENDTPTQVTSSLIVSDVDDTLIESATVSISNNFATLEDLLVFSNQLGITGTYNASTGVLTLTGASSVINYQTALRSVAYENISDDPSTLTRTLSIVVNDGDVDSNILSRNIIFTAINDAPVLSALENTPATYTENDLSLTVTDSLVLQDIDNIQVDSATISISGNFAAGEDTLNLTNQSGISGNYNTATGVLSLTGAASVADYQAAIRSITYNNSSDDPSPLTRTISFTINDGALDSNTPTRDIQFTAVNDAPELSAIESTPVLYTENGVPVPLSSTLLLADLDDINIESATVSISSNYAAGEDRLLFASQSGISSVFNTATGTLTLTGTATVADYQSALRSVTYDNTSDDPSALTRTLDFQINDGALNSNVTSRQLILTATNDAPVLATIEGLPTSYTENDPATMVTGNLSLSDVDDSLVESATITITGNFASGEDVLSFINQNGISGIYSAGVMSLTGSATLADYETAIQSITYHNTSDDPSALTRTVSFVINDGDIDSNLLSRDIAFTAVNDAPVVSSIEPPTLSYVENDSPATLMPSFAIGDPDDTEIESATVAITGGFATGEDQLLYIDQSGITGFFDDTSGTLTLSGSATIAAYEAAIQSVTYQNISDNPSALTRQIDFTVSDSEVNSNTISRLVVFTAVNDSPVISAIETAPLAYTENDAATIITDTVSINDLDDAFIESATVAITGNFKAGEDILDFTDQSGISGSYDTGTGILQLTGSATLSDYEQALRSVTYENSSDDPSNLTRTVSITVSDGDVLSNLLARDIDFTAVNDAPALTSIEGLPAQFTENGNPIIVTENLSVSDVDDVLIEAARVSIVGNFAATEDSLSFTNTVAINGSYDSITGVLTLTGSASATDYQNALQSVTYVNTSNNPSSAQRTIEFVVNDGQLDSNLLARDIVITPVNDPSQLFALENTPLVFNENSLAAGLTSTIVLNDLDDTVLQSATVAITTNYSAGNDWLTFSNQSGITGNFDSATGIMTLSGTSSLLNYEYALRSVGFVNTSDDPTAQTRVVEFTVRDNSANSNTLARQIIVVPSNDAPTIAPVEPEALSYQENSIVLPVTDSITLADLDDTHLESAVVLISGNFSAGEDILNFTNQNGINGTYNPLTGVLVLSGTATVAEYEAALRSVAYANSSDNPSVLNRTIEFRVNDGDLTSNVSSRDVVITASNDRPVLLSIESDPVIYTENQLPLEVTETLSVTDVDNTSLESAKITLTTNYSANQDSLSFTPTGNITGVFDTSSGTLTLTGIATLAEYQNAIRSVTYQNSSDNPSTLPRTIEFSISDQRSDSAIISRVIAVQNVNDAPAGTDNVINFLEDTDYVLTAADFGFTDVLDNHSFDGIIIQKLPASGYLSLNGIRVTASQYIDITDIDNGNLVFTPEPDATGTDYDSFEFHVVDDGGTDLNGMNTSVSAHDITFNVININDEPSGADKTVSTQEDTTYIFDRSDFGFTDVLDGDNFQAITIIALPENGVLALDGAPVASATIIDVTLIDAGLLRYTPPLNVNGLGYNGFSFQVHDDGGIANGGEFIDQTENYINFDVPGVNDPPLLIKEVTTVDEGSDNTINTDMLSATDADDLLPQELTFTINSLPVNGVLRVNGIPATAGTTFTLEQLQQDEIRYIHDGSETSVDFFDIQVSDGGEDGSEPATGRFAFLINEVIDPPPVIDNESVMLEFGEVFDSDEGSLLDSGDNSLAADSINANPRFIVSIESTPSRGSVVINSDGTFTYEHDGSAVLQDSFSYRVTNEDGIFAIATVDVSIEPPLANAFETPDTIEPVVTPEEPEPEDEVNEKTEQTETEQEEGTQTQTDFDPARGSAPAPAEARAGFSRSTEVTTLGDIEFEQTQRRTVEAILAELNVQQHNTVQYANIEDTEINISTVGLEILTEVRTVKPHDVVTNKQFVDGLKRLDQDLQDSEDSDTRRYRLANDATLGVSLSATAGIIAWALRGGALFASAMASTPLWASMDPVRVLAGKRDENSLREDNVVEQYFAEK